MESSNINCPSIMGEKKLAQSLGISYWTVRKWRLNSGLPFMKNGNRYFYNVESVRSWLRKKEQQNRIEETAV